MDRPCSILRDVTLEYIYYKATLRGSVESFMKSSCIGLRRRTGIISPFYLFLLRATRDFVFLTSTHF